MHHVMMLHHHKCTPPPHSSSQNQPLQLSHKYEFTNTDTQCNEKAAIKYLNKALKQVKHTDKLIRVHIDGGANRSITNDISLLSNFKNIKRYSMQGVAANEPALYCAGIGLLPWKADNGDVIFVKCYYSEAAADTIISPTEVVINYITALNAWGQYSNIDTGEG